MIFAILGILVLVISFVIALVTLIREQNKLDKQPGEGRAVVNGELRSTADTPKPIVDAPKPVVTVSPQESYQVAELSSQATGGVSGMSSKPEVVSQTERPKTWWDEKLVDDVDKNGGKQEDEEAIQKLREELAKMTMTKKDIGIDTANAQRPQEEPNDRITKSDIKNSLSGGFSLREIEKKD